MCVVLPSLHCCYSDVTVRLQWCYTVITLLFCCQLSICTLLLPFSVVGGRGFKHVAPVTEATVSYNKKTTLFPPQSSAIIPVWNTTVITDLGLLEDGAAPLMQRHCDSASTKLFSFCTSWRFTAGRLPTRGRCCLISVVTWLTGRRQTDESWDRKSTRLNSSHL